MEKVKILSTVKEIKAISDPYRIEIMNVFYTLNRPVNVKEIADSLGEVPAKVHYHVKKLEDAGILELVSTKEINGIVSKYYEPVAQGFNIKREHVDPAMRNAVINQAQEMVSAIYDRSKRIYIDCMEKFNAADDTDGAAARTNSLHAADICLPREKAEELHKYIKGFIEKYEKEGSEEGDTYHIFFTMIGEDKEP